jgi:hypothetical protein
MRREPPARRSACLSCCYTARPSLEKDWHTVEVLYGQVHLASPVSRESRGRTHHGHPLDEFMSPGKGRNPDIVGIISLFTSQLVNVVRATVDVRRGATWCEEASLDVRPCFVVGFLGETRGICGTRWILHWCSCGTMMSTLGSSSPRGCPDDGGEELLRMGDS